MTTTSATSSTATSPPTRKPEQRGDSPVRRRRARRQEPQKDSRRPLLNGRTRSASTRLNSGSRRLRLRSSSRFKADPDLAQRFAILTSIPGVSAITAFALLIEMPELGALDAGQAASLAGLAPIARQSGRWTGHAFIRGGRAAVCQAAVCQAVYMPALVAIRFNPDMKAKYKELMNAGKPTKGRPHRRHGQAHRPRKRPPEGQPKLDPKTRLIKTDTLARRPTDAPATQRQRGGRPGDSRLPDPLRGTD
jgi:hypothetical protein